jgi:iron-sulfur cluster repair protein YtfE (RIC family)
VFQTGVSRSRRKQTNPLPSLEMAEQSAHAAQKDRDWQVEPLADLIAHIKNTHYKYTCEEIARLMLAPI